MSKRGKIQGGDAVYGVPLVLQKEQTVGSHPCRMQKPP